MTTRAAAFAALLGLLIAAGTARAQAPAATPPPAPAAAPAAPRPAPPPAAPAKPTLLVFNLVAEQGIEKSVTNLLTELIIDKVSKLNRYTVMGQKDLEKMVFWEQNKQLQGCTDSSCLVQIAGAMGASFYIEGSAGSVGSQYIITLKLIDAHKVEVVSRSTTRVKKDDDVMVETVVAVPGEEGRAREGRGRPRRQEPVLALDDARDRGRAGRGRRRVHRLRPAGQHRLRGAQDLAEQRRGHYPAQQRDRRAVLPRRPRAHRHRDLPLGEGVARGGRADGAEGRARPRPDRRRRDRHLGREVVGVKTGARHTAHGARVVGMIALAAVLGLPAAACVELSDAGTEGGKCFDDGACEEGLACDAEMICRKGAETDVDVTCDGKKDGDACRAYSKDGQCIPGPSGLWCAVLCDTAGESCADGHFCYMKSYDKDKDEQLLLCAKPSSSAAGALANCGYWNACKDGLQCVKQSDVPRCYSSCSSDTDCTTSGQSCKSVPSATYKVCAP